MKYMKYLGSLMNFWLAATARRRIAASLFTVMCLNVPSISRKNMCDDRLQSIIILNPFLPLKKNTVRNNWVGFKPLLSGRFRTKILWSVLNHPGFFFITTFRSVMAMDMIKFQCAGSAICEKHGRYGNTIPYILLWNCWMYTYLNTDI